MRQRLADAIDRARALLAAAADEDEEGIVNGVMHVLDAVKRGEPPPLPSSDGDARALRRQIDALLQALHSAEEDLRRRDDFLAVVAHELRNPLAPVTFMVDVMMREQAANRRISDESLTRHLTMFRRQIERLEQDLNRLLDFSRIRSGRLDLQLEEVDFAAVVREVVADLAPQLAAAKCEVRLSAATAEAGSWDRLRLRQVVWNLVTNAAKFGAGSPVDITVIGRAAAVELHVADRGPGIAEDERDRVFHRFERGSQNAHTGFGVGLWLVNQIVEALGGTIAITSEPGAGSTFTVTLPRRPHGRS